MLWSNFKSRIFFHNDSKCLQQHIWYEKWFFYRESFLTECYKLIIESKKWFNSIKKNVVSKVLTYRPTSQNKFVIHRPIKLVYSEWKYRQGLSSRTPHAFTLNPPRVIPSPIKKHTCSSIFNNIFLNPIPSLKHLVTFYTHFLWIQAWKQIRSTIENLILQIGEKREHFQLMQLPTPPCI